MTVSQKILFSFLLSALLCAGIAAFAVTGVIAVYAAITGATARILIFTAIFLTSFLIIFFCLNLRRSSAAGFSSAEAVPVESITGRQGSLFLFRHPFTFTTLNPELLRDAENEVVYEQNGIHYINNDVFGDERSDDFDNNFAKLVESVVKNGRQASREFELT